MIYDALDMLPKRAFQRDARGQIMPQSGGGSSGSSAPTSQTVTSTSIPEYARPYAESMLGQTSALTDINQNPYQPYKGQMTAGFSPMQVQGMTGVANQQIAPQLTDASNIAGHAGAASMAYGAEANAYGGEGFKSGQFGQQLGIQGGGQYGGMGAGYGQAGAGLAGANIGTGQAGMAAGMSYGQNAQNPNAVQGYMNPYLQNTLQPSLALLNQQYGMQGAAEQGAATSAGAFGGSREGIQRAELERGLAEQRNQTIMGGLQQGYTQALGASEAEKNRLLQGTQAGAGIASLQQQLGQGDVNFLYNLGQSQQRQSQAELDALRSTNLQRTMQPFQNLAFLSDIYKGAPSTQMTAGTVTQPAPSPFQQFTGLATGLVAGAGAAKMAGVL
jgi:hypothetical protein